MAEPTIRMLWGLAKSPELHLSDEELHLVVSAHTGKDSIRKLNKSELRLVIGILTGMKDSASGNKRNDRRNRGNAGTANQRRKIYKLTEILGWSKPARINGLCKKMFGVACVEWLNYQQCFGLIEALKSMAERKEEQDESRRERDHPGQG